MVINTLGMIGTHRGFHININVTAVSSFSIAVLCLAFIPYDRKHKNMVYNIYQCVVWPIFYPDPKSIT